MKWKRLVSYASLALPQMPALELACIGPVMPFSQVSQGVTPSNVSISSSS